MDKIIKFVQLQHFFHYFYCCLTELKAMPTSKNIMTTVMSSMTSSSYFHFLKAALTSAFAAASGAFYK